MKPEFSKSIIFAAILALSMISQGCVDTGSDTTGDTTQHEMDRQNASADHIESQYAQIKGQFSGTYNDSSVLLTIDVARETSTGNGDLGLVPLPHLVGTLALNPPLFVSDSGHPIDLDYAVTDGQFVSGNDLSLVVMENGTQTTLHCPVTNLTRLDCSWYMNASTTSHVKFTLERVGTGQSLVSRDSTTKFDGSYEGSNANYAKIVANFRMFLEPQSGSLAVPQVSIVGDFTFYPVPTAEEVQSGEDPGSAERSFTDGEYDPISNKLALKIAGDNPIEVNCTIQTQTSLHCVWIGAQGLTSYEEFDLNKISISKKSP